MIHQSASGATSKVVLRSLYRSLLRASSPFSQPAYASLIHRSGVAHDWEECIHRLDIKRRAAAADVTKSSSVVSSTSSSFSSNDVNNDDNNKKHDNAPEKSIPKSWAQNLSRSYTDLQQEYELRKDYFDQRFGTDDFDDDDDDDDDDRWETDLVMGTSSHYRHEVQYSISDDPKYILFRQLLREWFTSSSGDNISNNNNETDNGVKSNKWPKEWSPNAEGYYENGKIKQVPLMRFPSQIVSSGGLSIREMIKREFRAPSVEDRLSMELAFAKQQIKDKTSIPIYPSSSYIDTDIRVQTAFLSLMELNRKLAWAESVGFPATSQQQKSNQEERKWKRLVQAAKGVTAFPPLTDISKQSDDIGDINIVDDDDGSNEEPDDKTNNKKNPSTLQCGTYLIAHPLMAGYFAKSVIVLLDHTEEVNSNLAKTEEGGGGGTYGLIINRLALQSEMVESSRGHLDLLRQKWDEEKSKLGEEPMVVQGTSLELATSPKSLSSEQITDIASTSQGTTEFATTKGITQNIQRPISLLQAINADDLPETVVMAFGDAHVRDGGPVNLSLQMIHRKKSDQDDTNEEDEGKQKEGSTSIVGGTMLGTDNDNLLESEEIYFNGDVVQASHDVLKGKSDVDDYSFIIGAACWSPGQLEHEIERGCWLPFRGPPHMAMTGMCEHNDFTIPISENGDGTELAGGTKLSMFPPRPSNTATSSVAGSVGKTASQQQPSLPKERPVGDLWLSVMCALGEGEADLAYMMLNNKNVSNKLGDACDNFDR